MDDCHLGENAMKIGRMTDVWGYPHDLGFTDEAMDFRGESLCKAKWMVSGVYSQA